MTTLPTYTGGEKPTPAQWSAASKLLQAMGGTDDGGGSKGFFARCPELALAIFGGDTTLASKTVTSGASYTVPASTLYVIRRYDHASGVTDTVTPSGGFAINISTIAESSVRDVCLILGPGDQVVMGAGSYCSGYLVALPTDAAFSTRILKFVDNTTTHTVTAGDVMFLAHASNTSGNTGRIVLAGVTGPRLPDPGSSSVPWPVLRNHWLKAGETIAGDTTTDVLISGIEFNAT